MSTDLLSGRPLMVVDVSDPLRPLYLSAEGSFSDDLCRAKIFSMAAGLMALVSCTSAQHPELELQLFSSAAENN